MENKDMTGVLFPVEDKKTDKHPDFTGNVLVNDEKYYISAWKNIAKSGIPYISLKINEDQKKQDSDTSNQNDDIPF